MRPGPTPEGEEAEVARHAFQLLTRLLPPSFRAAYGEEMTELFLRRLERARARGRRAAVSLWLRSTVDLLRTTIAERTDRRSGPSHGSVPLPHRNRAPPVQTLLQDVRYAVRRLIRTPVFTIGAVSILAVGIGANAAAFGLVDAILFRPLPFERPDEVVYIYQDADDGEPASSSFPAYRDMTEASEVFTGVAATSADVVTWETDAGPREAAVTYTTSSYLPVLGLSPALGRWFEPAHDRAGAGPVAVVSHRTWRRALGADPGAVGSTVRLNGQPVTVIGVGPRSYDGPGGAIVTDFWLSISSVEVGGPGRVGNLDRRQDHWYDVVARLAPGVSLEAAQARMTALAMDLARTYPELNQGRDITVFGQGDVRIHPRADGFLVPAGVSLLAVVGLVLLLACSNLANLLMVRGASRSSEMAVRRALGASRGRVGRLFLVESLVLTMTGGAAGLGLAAWLVNGISRVAIPVPGLGAPSVAVDHRVILFGLGLAAATGVVFGLGPGLRSAGADVAHSMREDRRVGRGRGFTLLRGVLVGVQVAISVVLLVGAALTGRNLVEARRADPGFDPAPVAMMGTNLTRSGVSGAEVPVVIDELVRRVEALPGVVSAGLTTRLPATPGGSTTTVIEGYEPASGTGAVELALAVVDDGYFEAMGIPTLEGRTFTANDGMDLPLVNVVSETAARRFWGGRAVGRRVRPDGDPDAWREVVGVVADVPVNSLQEAPTPMIYFHSRQLAPATFTLVARTEGDAATLAPALRGELSAVRISLPVTRIGTLEDHLRGAAEGPRTAAALLGMFSVLALLLASMGIYAVVSFAVAGRTSELGIRIALGAGRRRLIRMVLVESLVPVLIGLVVGVAVAGAGSRMVSELVAGIEGIDPVSLAGGALVLLGVATVASWLPARRAAGVDPMAALRGE